MMKCCVLFVLTIKSVLGYSQQTTIDSLKWIVDHQKNSSEQVLNELGTLCALLIEQSSPNQGIPYFLKMSGVAEKLDSNRQYITANLYLSESYRRLNDPTNAIRYANRVLNKDGITPSQKILGVNALGRVYHHFQKYKDAIRTYTNGIKQVKNDTLTALLATVYINLGISYNRMGRRDQELRCYLKGLDVADKVKDGQAQNFALYTIANMYVELEQYEKAESYFLKGIANAEHNRLAVYTSMNYHGLGMLYAKWGKWEEARHYDLLALAEFRKRGDRLYEFDVLNNLGELYYLQDSFEVSISFANQAIHIAEELNHLLAQAGAQLTLSGSLMKMNRLAEADGYLSKLIEHQNDLSWFSRESRAKLLEYYALLRERQGKIAESLEYYKQASLLRDSLLREQRDSKIAYFENLFQSERKDRENAELTSQNQKLEFAQKQERTTFITIVIVLASIAFIVLLIAVILRQRAKARELSLNESYQLLLIEQHGRLEEGKRIERIRIADELHDDIASELNGIYLALDSLQLDENTRKYVKRVRGVSERTRELSSLLGLQNQEELLGFTSLLEDLVSLYVHSPIQIVLELDGRVKQMTFNKQAQITLYRIIQEALNNVHKHANEATYVSVRMVRDPHHLSLIIEDNGKIVHPLSIRPKHIMKRVRELKGALTIAHDKGTTLSIVFPLKHLV